MTAVQTMRWGAGVALVTIAGVALGVAPASADTSAGTASVASASYTKAGSSVTVPALAQCSVEGPTSASSDPVREYGFSIGGGQSSCVTTVVDPASDETKTTSTASGHDVDLSALISVGGPRIGLAKYQVTCTGTKGHSTGSWTFSGLTGIDGPPAQVPPNYTEPIIGAGRKVVANAVFDAVDQPADGSTTVTMLRIIFAPDSGITGSVSIGTATCAPTP